MKQRPPFLNSKTGSGTGTEILSQNRRFEDLAKLKGNLESIANQSNLPIKFTRCVWGTPKKSQAPHTKVDRIKKPADLEQDLIVVDKG